MLSVIVLVHNRAAMSAECLRALSTSVSSVPHEVLCLDNVSTEDLHPVREAGGAFRRFRLLRLREGLSFSEANNLGASVATGDWLLFLNNDVVTGAAAVQALVEVFQQEASVGAVGARLLFGGGRRIQHAGITQMLWGYISNFGAGAAPQEVRLQQRAERFAVSGAMMCVPRRVFDRAGGFDRRYRWGYEDVDLCLRLRGLGLSIVYEPRAESIHLESATLGAVRNGRDAARNYRVYRHTWDSLLQPREQKYLQKLRRDGIRRVVIFGRGRAARGLFRMLQRNGVKVAAFTDTHAARPGETFCARPVMPLGMLQAVRFDRLMAGTQFFFELESVLARHDPAGTPIYPQVC